MMGECRFDRVVGNPCWIGGTDSDGKNGQFEIDNVTNLRRSEFCQVVRRQIWGRYHAGIVKSFVLPWDNGNLCCRVREYFFEHVCGCFGPFVGILNKFIVICRFPTDCNT